MAADPQSRAQEVLGSGPASGPVGPACRLVGISKHFGGVWACRHVDLEIFPGEVHAILGENGAGKSTLMKMLHGFYIPEEGHIEVGGARVNFPSPRDAEAAGVALIPQELDLFPDLSVVENLFVGRKRPRNNLGGFDWSAMRRQALELFKTLGVELDVNAPARRLSGANAQMVEIARALIRDARIVLMDEPTAALTEREAEKLFSITRDLTSRGVAVVYISHRLEEIFKIANRVTVMRDGSRIHTGAITDMTLSGLIQMMVGRPLEKLFHRSPRVVGPPVLEVHQLCRRGVFEDITLTVRSGEVVGLSGLIGAGRSEVAQAIFGIHPASGGAIRVHGQNLQVTNPHFALNNGIVYVPEERRSQGLLLDFPIEWNISFSSLPQLSRFGWVMRRNERAMAEQFQKLFAIRGGDMESPVSSLSGGNQQKVLLSKCLVLRPHIILLDEPTRGVDVGAKAEIYRIIDDLALSGKAILMISSELNELLSMSDRILVMHQGRLTANFDGPNFSADQIGAAAAGVFRMKPDELSRAGSAPG